MEHYGSSLPPVVSSLHRPIDGRGRTTQTEGSGHIHHLSLMASDAIDAAIYIRNLIFEVTNEKIPIDVYTDCNSFHLASLES